MRIPAMVAGLLLLGWALALSVTDLRRRRLPNVLTLGGAVLILLAAIACGRGLSAVLGALALGGIYLAVHLVDPAALGGGDVKLAAALGGLTGALGPSVWALAAFAAPLLTAVAGTVLLVVRRSGVRGAPALPHGPSMCLASLAAVALAAL